jgi:hypothetical protein
VADIRRSRLDATSTGKCVSPTKRDLLWFQKLAQHGPLSSSFLLEFSQHMRVSDKRSRERLTDLFHEARTADGGPYLTRPAQQFRTLDSRYNQIVYDLAPAGRRAIKRLAYDCLDAKAHVGPWLHHYMVSSITASIELATLATQHLRFIPEAEILMRAGTELRFPTQIEGRRKDLIPDALFGLEYLTESGSRFRFFVVEADRATEPLSASSFSRKSFERNMLQYAHYVGDGAYKEHLGLTSPLLVLMVSSDAKRTAKMQEFAKRHYPNGNLYLLFQTWEDFGPVFRPPDPNYALLTKPWERAEMEAFQIDEP